MDFNSFEVVTSDVRKICLQCWTASIDWKDTICRIVGQINYLARKPGEGYKPQDILGVNKTSTVGHLKLNEMQIVWFEKQT